MIRVRVSSGAEAERFNAAYYQFLRTHARSADRAAECWVLKTVADRGEELKIAKLWSLRAASRFTELWNSGRSA